MSSTVPTPPAPPVWSLGSASAALVAARTAHSPEAIFVATMSGQFALDALGVTARRIDSVPLMGGASGLGLGIAIARPDIPVIVLDGDSSLLMELGSLVTVARRAPRRYLHVVVDNGVQFNGLTNLPAVSRAGAAPGVDFAGMALAAGYACAERVDSLARWVEALPRLLAAEGPSFVDLVVPADPRRIGPSTPQPLLPELQFVRMRQAVRRLRAEL